MTTAGGLAPMVSIGIPLYQARPFVDRIARNVESHDDPHIEFVLADQHRRDDAVAVLRARLGGDQRVRIFESSDGLDWIQNYNFVLRRARGKYFRLLAQDDVIPPHSIAAAVACLEADPEVVIVDGPVDLIDRDGRVQRPDPGPGRASPPDRWPRADALALLTGWRHETANLGLVRRSVAVDHGLWLPDTAGKTGLSMRAWLFSVALRGRIQTLPAYRNLRCLHPESFTATHRGRSIGEEAARLASYVGVSTRAWNAAGVSAFERLWGPAAIALAAGFVLPLRRGAQRLARRLGGA